MPLAFGFKSLYSVYLGTVKINELEGVKKPRIIDSKSFIQYLFAEPTAFGQGHFKQDFETRLSRLDLQSERVNRPGFSSTLP